jgi:transposase
MSFTRLLITAVVIENRSVAQVAAQYGVSQSRLFELVARYKAEGQAAFEPRSRRPKTVPRTTPAEVVDLIVEYREKLTTIGLDAGPDTIAWHLEHHHGVTVSRATISRYLQAHGPVTPEPKKKPKSSYVRFAAAMPNETWQADFTHYRLTRPDGRRGADCEILTWLDDCSRFALSVTAHHRVTGTIVLATFRQTLAEHGIPASTLTDNGMVFTTRLAQGKRGAGTRNAFETELRPQHRPEELHPGSSHHLRHGRTLPADPEEVAPRPTRAAHHDRRPPSPPRRIRRGVQRPPATPLPGPPGHPRHGLHDPSQGDPEYR